MAKYTKRPDFSSVYIPGFGQLSGTQVIEGDFDRFVPALLVKVADEAPARVPAKAEPAPPEPAPEPSRREDPTTKMETEELEGLVASEKAAAAMQRGGKKTKK